MLAFALCLARPRRPSRPLVPLRTGHHLPDQLLDDTSAPPSPSSSSSQRPFQPQPPSQYQSYAQAQPHVSLPPPHVPPLPYSASFARTHYEGAARAPAVPEIVTRRLVGPWLYYVRTQHTNGVKRRLRWDFPQSLLWLGVVVSMMFGAALWRNLDDLLDKPDPEMDPQELVMYLRHASVGLLEKSLESLPEAFSSGVPLELVAQEMSAVREQLHAHLDAGLAFRSFPLVSEPSDPSLKDCNFAFCRDESLFFEKRIGVMKPYRIQSYWHVTPPEVPTGETERDIRFGSFLAHDGVGHLARIGRSAEIQLSMEIFHTKLFCEPSESERGSRSFEYVRGITHVPPTRIGRLHSRASVFRGIMTLQSVVLEYYPNPNDTSVSTNFIIFAEAGSGLKGLQSLEQLEHAEYQQQVAFIRPHKHFVINIEKSAKK